MRISDWSSDVCSSDLYPDRLPAILHRDRSQNEAVGQAVGRVEGSVIVEASRLAALSEQGAADFHAAIDIRPIGEIAITHMRRPVIALAYMLAGARAVVILV